MFGGFVGGLFLAYCIVYLPVVIQLLGHQEGVYIPVKISALRDANRKGCISMQFMYAGCNLIKTQSLYVARFVNIYHHKQVAERGTEEVIFTNRKQCPERKRGLLKPQVKAVASFLCVS